jgi:hypothetical protein
VLSQILGKRLPPTATGLVRVAEGGVHLAEPVQSVGLAVGVADVPQQDECLLEAGEGQSVLPAPVGQPTQRAEDVRFAVPLLRRPDAIRRACR